MAVREFKIQVPQAKLDRLRRRLEDFDDPPVEMEDAEWQYGPPLYVAGDVTFVTSRSILSPRLIARDQI